MQPQDPALSGGGIDQSLQNGDILNGTRREDVQIGLLGVGSVAMAIVVVGGTLAANLVLWLVVRPRTLPVEDLDPSAVAVAH